MSFDSKPIPHFGANAPGSIQGCRLSCARCCARVRDLCTTSTHTARLSPYGFGDSHYFCEREDNSQSAATANAAQHLFDSLLPRKLLSLQLIEFGSAPLRPWPSGVGSRNRASGVPCIGESRRLYSLRRNGGLGRRIMLRPLQLWGVGGKRPISRSAPAKAHTQAYQ